jgi:tRNA (Thr-GGU) A37 N-methylase
MESAEGPPADVTVRAIGVVEGGRTEVADDRWGAVEATIVVDEAVVGPDALVGLADFSHVEVVFGFHRCDPAAVVRGRRHPRGDASLPAIGVLSQRVKDRPNHLGLSRCAVVAVDGNRLAVRGLDAVAGTPVYDVKPYLPEMVPDPATVRTPPWVATVMADYW